MAKIVSQLCFNSILVQLEVCVAGQKNPIATKFQFHIGAIRRNKAMQSDLPVPVFQFHIGAIRSYQSTLTALKHESFQFHIGAIRSYQDHMDNSDYVNVSIPYWCN